MSTWGERLEERTQPLQPNDEQYGWAHAILCETLAQPFLQVAELIDPPDPYPPWGPLFDLAACPGWALPWLAQAVGVRLPTGLSEDQQRSFIGEASGHRVGTADAMRAAANLTLVSSKPPAPPTMWFRERNGSAYRLEVVTDPTRADGGEARRARTDLPDYHQLGLPGDDRRGWDLRYPRNVLQHLSAAVGAHPGLGLKNPSTAREPTNGP
jgi:hypothetical protein